MKKPAMQVLFHKDVYHIMKNFYSKKNNEYVVTHCGLHVENPDVVDNDPKLTTPRCLKCLNHLME